MPFAAFPFLLETTSNNNNNRPRNNGRRFSCKSHMNLSSLIQCINFSVTQMDFSSLISEFNFSSVLFVNSRLVCLLPVWIEKPLISSISTFYLTEIACVNTFVIQLNLKFSVLLKMKKSNAMTL